MRLLHAKTLKFHEFEGSRIPEYAILSHRWEEEEVSYQDMLTLLRRLSKKGGFMKIQQCCIQAVKDELDYVWIDTCCIDKTSSAELSEAINSMYRWYQISAICYVYLSDVHPELTNTTSDPAGIVFHKHVQIRAQVERSKWWTRGWTLQELIAPRKVRFFGKGRHGWMNIGDKLDLLDLITQRSRINEDILCGADVQQCSIAMRMSWAAGRETTRSEDLAYCLLGIFQVNMPLLYGEGERAFLRLQQEIMEQSDDQTLFAWEFDSNEIRADICGPLATSPSAFRGCMDLIPVPDSNAPIPYSMTNKGLRIELPISKKKGQRRGIAILQCSTLAIFPRRIKLPIVQVNQQEDGHFGRDGRHIDSLKPAELDEIKDAIPKTIFLKQDPNRNIEWRVPFRILQYRMPSEYYQPRYSSPRLVARRTDTEDRSARTFVMSSSKQRGAIIYGRSGLDVLIIFSIGMQDHERISCKILQLNEYLDTSPRYARVQELLSSINGHVHRYRDLATESDQNSEFVIEQRVSELHGYYTTGSNSRISLAYLSQNLALSAMISPQVIHGQRTLVLVIETHKVTKVGYRFAEMGGGEARQVVADEEKEEIEKSREEKNYKEALKTLEGLKWMKRWEEAIEIRAKIDRRQ